MATSSRSRSRSPTKKVPIPPPTATSIDRHNLSKSENTSTPITPPARYISSNFSTPGSPSYNSESPAVIVELSPRYLRAGFGGESHAQCRIDFKPTSNKRTGDYRQYLPGYVAVKEDCESKAWGQDYELWRNDILDLDLGLLRDKLERTMTEVYNKHLLVDAGVARVVLVLPSLVPHPVLNAILQTLFERWPIPSITLLPTSTSVLVAGGLRSGLVVDVGWEETVCTVVYEYREVRTCKSIRAMKLLTRGVAKWVGEKLGGEVRTGVDTVEGMLRRIGPIMLKETEEDVLEDEGEEMIEIEWLTDTFTKHVSIAKDELRENLMQALIGKEEEQYPDDEEIPVHRLIYKALLGLSPDIRGICMSRIVFTGDGSDTLKLQALVLDAFSRLLKRRGWTEVQGQKSKRRREGLSELAQGRVQPADARHDEIVWNEKVFSEERHLRETMKRIQPSVHSVVRQVNSLGPWAGASLLTTLKIKSFVEIQREKFLSHGMSGASREIDVSVVPQRTSTLSVRPKAGERTSWTLSGWG